MALPGLGAGAAGDHLGQGGGSREGGGKGRNAAEAHREIDWDKVFLAADVDKPLSRQHSSLFFFGAFGSLAYDPRTHPPTHPPDQPPTHQPTNQSTNPRVCNPGLAHWTSKS